MESWRYVWREGVEPLLATGELEALWEACTGDDPRLLQGATTTSVQEIDKLITELQTLRDTLHSERARVQREIVQYSTLTRATLESTKIVAESLMQFKKITDAPALPDLKDRSVAS